MGGSTSGAGPNGTAGSGAAGSAGGGSGSGGTATAGATGAGGDDASGGAGGEGGAGGASGGVGGGGAAGGSAGASGGGSAGASGGGGVAGGPGVTGHRYVRFVATSAQGSSVWTAVAEFRLFTTGDAPIDRSSWMVSADSEETDDENAPAIAAIDGNNATFWHTEWEPNGVGDAPLPHELRIDLGTARVITGFSYLPRQDQANGRIAGWEIYLSKDDVTWGTAVDSGTFPAGTALQKVTF